MKIGFDVGGVLSKHPKLKSLFNSLSKIPGVEVYVISDMHPKEAITNMLSMNNLDFKHENVFSADYVTHGEQCKKVICEEIGIDIMIDDFIGYVAGGKHIRLLVMPDPDEDYYSEDWKTDGKEGNFGRRRKSKG